MANGPGGRGLDLWGGYTTGRVPALAIFEKNLKTFF